MEDESRPSTDDTQTDPFELLGNEQRAAIVETLGDARVEAGVRPTVSFSELRARADLDIPSSQFNYHLQRLLGTFVEKTEDGYRMRVEGRLVYQALRAGTFDRAGPASTHDLDVDCYYCDGTLQATFEDGVARVECRDCEHLYEILGVPPAVLNADGDDAVERFVGHCRQKRFAFANGDCPTCGAAVGTEIRRSPEIPFDDDETAVVRVYRLCENCGDQFYLSLGEALLYDPAVVSFCLERGLDVVRTPSWEIPFAATDRSVALLSEEPLRLSLTVSLADDELELVVDGSLAVVERNRR
ncbi:hypothetical protein [Haloarchaeobius sp. FL176]|uniref:DUF7351 domain-containing protein n=1 Tax=Haloarchaeobius sp. FL176 TaxID=2967129 RepID=UPI002148C2E2|nr:hypothetical protein [Haloarchaeobius sp. FL176]